MIKTLLRIDSIMVNGISPRRHFFLITHLGALSHGGRILHIIKMRFEDPQRPPWIAAAENRMSQLWDVSVGGTAELNSFPQRR